MTITLPAFLAGLDWSHLIAAVLPVVLLALGARYPALAPLLAVLFPKPVAPAPAPAPDPAKPDAPKLPDTGRPVLDGLLNVLIPLLIRKHGAETAHDAVALEIRAVAGDPAAK